MAAMEFFSLYANVNSYEILLVEMIHYKRIFDMKSIFKRILKILVFNNIQILQKRIRAIVLYGFFFFFNEIKSTITVNDLGLSLFYCGVEHKYTF